MTQGTSQEKIEKIEMTLGSNSAKIKYKDIEEAAMILKGRHVAKNVRAIIIPATQSIHLECIKRGYIETFINAGCVVSTHCGEGTIGILYIVKQ